MSKSTSQVKIFPVEIPVMTIPVHEQFPDVPKPHRNPYAFYFRAADGIDYVAAAKDGAYQQSKPWKIRRGTILWVAVHQVYVGQEYIAIYPGTWITEERWCDCKPEIMPDLPLKLKWLFKT
jgi:hypothetical protein